MKLRQWLFIVAVVPLLILQGCGAASYYLQSVNGHLNVVSAARPIDRLLDDSSNTPELREQLTLARDVRQFAIEKLALPDNNSYRNYVDTRRDYVTWSVFAADELSFNIRTWCFPVVGCVPYRGYFSKEDAQGFAEGLRDEGLDVYVGGVPAYSTLGRFPDPLLNTMLRYGETYLAGVIFHELSHQRVYVPDDTEFNEAFAVAVEQSGTTRWLNHQADAAALKRYEASQRRNDDFLSLIIAAREELRLIYAGGGSEDEKRAAKASAIDALRARYRRIRDTRWNGYDGYDDWFAEPINNAKLATISVYNDLVPDFTRLLGLCAGDYKRFYQAVERIGQMDKMQRRLALKDANQC